jgi:ribose/xylose/arabinose/galactoside ABC-type transport system permease subunit
MTAPRARPVPHKSICLPNRVQEVITGLIIIGALALDRLRPPRAA